VTARSSASRTARPSPCSSRGRTPVRSHGRLCTDGCTRRVSLRLVHTLAYANTRWERDTRALRDMTSAHRRMAYGQQRAQPSLSLPQLPSHTQMAQMQTEANHRHLTGSRQEAYPPHSQAPACHRRCLARCDQGAPYSAPRGPRRRSLSRRQGRKGEEGRRRVKEEGREGQERVWRRTWPGNQDSEQAGLQGCRTQGTGKDSLSGMLCIHGSGFFGGFSG
jgi:hypothetical protein